MHSQKIHNKKLILPVLIFLAGCLALAAVLYHSYRTNLKQVRAVTELMPQPMQNGCRMI